MDEKPRILFISHSSYDKDYVSQIVDLLRKQGLDKDQIFCSSYPGYGIPSGRNIFDFLRTRLVDYDPYVLFVISKDNYYASPACLNEMGASWALGSVSNAILLPGTRPMDLRGALGDDILSIVLDSDEARYRLTDLRDDILGFLSVKVDSSSTWEYDRDRFLSECAAIAKTTRKTYLPGADMASYYDDLVERRVPVSQSLRRALGVSRRQGENADTAWISAELLGYDANAEVPEYRKVFSVEFRYSGFSGNMQVTNAMLPLHYLDDETLEVVSNGVLGDGVESIERLAAADREVTRNVSSLIPLILSKTEGFCQCSSIVQIIPTSAVDRVITAVEDRLMQFFAKSMG